MTASRKRTLAMATPSILLSDAAMRNFVVDGCHAVAPADMPTLPTTFHDAIAAKLARRFEEASTRESTRNEFLDSLLHELPELEQLFADPAVNGALTSILGDDWSLHSHSYVHDRWPRDDEQREMVHKDGGFSGCYDGLCTRTRWALLLYYPQAVEADFGPTEVAPGTHYLFENPQPDPSIPCTPLLSPTPGTLIITTYELWHRATHNRATAPGDRRGPRFMLKVPDRRSNSAS